MGLAKRIVGTTVAVVVVASGAYLYADARDWVPGYLTLAPVPSPAAPFPTPPGAVPASDLPDPVSGPRNTAPEPSQATLDAAVTTLLHDKDRVGKSVGLVVADTVTGKILVKHTPAKPKTPASTVKLLTAVAAGTVLDLSSRLPTTTTLQGHTVTLVGGGDMMLAQGKGDNDAVNGHAGLGDLARKTTKALRLKGITNITLAMDDTLFSRDTASVWDLSTTEQGWAAPVTPLAVDTGRRTSGEYAPRYSDPAIEAARVFAQRLKRQGITVKTTVRGQSPEGAQRLAEVDSARLGDIVDYMLQRSDNTITEVVGRLVAVHEELPASFDGATTAVLTVLRTHGVPTEGAHLVDCSGLADGTKIPARTLLGTVQTLVSPDGTKFRDIVRGLPIGGLTGTLADRYRGSEIAGVVRAKTGSLTKVKSLAGTVMTEDQRQLSFVVIADKAPSGVPWATRAALDEFVEDIAE